VTYRSGWIVDVSGQKRWVELDGVRGLAALLVLYAHLFLIWMPSTPAPVFWLRTLTGQAWTGVYLFYTLSGFLIGGVLLQNRPAGNYFRVFYGRRALRILPVYFVLLLIFFMVRLVPALGGLKEFSEGRVPFWNYFLLIQNFTMARTGDWGAAPLGVTWSVALEEQFYLFLPLWIRFIPNRWLPVSFLGLAAIGPLFRAVAPLAHAPFLVPGSGEALFFGTWLAWAFGHKEHIFKNPLWRKSMLGLFALSAVGMVLLVTHRDFGVFSISVISIFWASFLWLVLAFMGTPWTAPLRHFTLRSVGGISYGVYLFHPLVNLMFFLALTGSPARHEVGSLKGFPIAVLGFVCTLALAWLSFYGMEIRLIALGRKLKYRAGLPQKRSE
jgi:peptidoglycan/LPS O-acetylase OafA/YrhL